MSPRQSERDQTADYSRSFLGALFRFKIDQRGDMGYFTQISGLSMTYEVLPKGTTREAQGTAYTPKHVASVEYGDISLGRGMSPDDRLNVWLEEWEQSTADRYTAAVDIMRSDGTVLDTFEFVEVWPKAWETSKLDVSGEEKVVETLVFAHEGMTRKRQ